MQNPLIPEILLLLRQNPQGLSEHFILKALADHNGFAGIGHQGQLPLFQKHFMVMNALYQLQQSLWKTEQLILEISPLLMQLYPVKQRNHSEYLALTESPSLSNYYLDWQHFEKTTEEDTLKLLASFWSHFVKTDQRAAALQILELEAGATAAEITRRYRELAAQHHPDKGGEKEQFILIRQAFEMLKAI